MNFKSKIFPGFPEFEKELQNWKKNGETLVFTNGCFDIIHHGHVDSLFKAAAMGTKLVVGLNSDDSVRRFKGRNRPVFDDDSRATILAAFSFVDAVILFDEDTPANLIKQIMPNILVKGKHYQLHEIAGHDTVLNSGGKVEILDLVPGISTSDIIHKIKELD